MYIIESYKYKKDGITYVANSVPYGAKILQVLEILCAEDEHELQRISDSRSVGNEIWLHDGDSAKNYIEVKVDDEHEFN